MVACGEHGGANQGEKGLVVHVFYLQKNLIIV